MPGLISGVGSFVKKLVSVSAYDIGRRDERIVVVSPGSVKVATPLPCPKESKEVVELLKIDSEGKVGNANIVASLSWSVEDVSERRISGTVIVTKGEGKVESPSRLVSGMTVDGA